MMFFVLVPSHDVSGRPYIVRCSAEEVGYVHVKGNASSTTMQNEVQIM